MGNTSTALSAAELPSPSPGEIRAQLERVLSSPVFARSGRLNRFLRFSVETALMGGEERLKEQVIGLEVFDRGLDYDPRIDPIVRVEARRLRAKLKAYYSSRGRADPILIGLPKGSYVPSFQFRQTHNQRKPERLASASKAVKSIAVIPFANLSQEAGDDYFSDGLTEELILLLTRIRDLRVVAWETTSKLRGREQDLTGIREQLQVSTVLRGSVRKTGGRVRVTAQLIHLEPGAESGAYLWAEAFDRELQDVFAIQEEIAHSIVSTLQLTLESRQLRGGSISFKCHNLCLQGRFHANKRTGEGLWKSIRCFEQAIEVEPSCAVAYAGLADAYSLLADYGLLNTSEALKKARPAAETALKIDPQCAEAYVSLAFFRSVLEWAWAEAGPLYRRAIALNPSYARAHHWYGTDYLIVLGQLDEALKEARIAHHLDPLSQITFEGCGYTHTLRREYEAALQTYRELLELDPGFYKAHSSLGRLYTLMGRYKDAIASFERARDLAGETPTLIAAHGQALGLAGRTKEAKAALEKLEHMSRSCWVPNACYGVLYLGLGDFDSALARFEKAVESRERGVTGFKVHPLYDPLRNDARFAALIRRVGLAT